MALINIAVNSTNNTRAGFQGVQQGLAGMARQTQQTAATMNAAFRGVSSEILGGLGIATGLGQVISLTRQLSSEGQDVQASLDRTRGSLGAVLGSQARANSIFDEANRFADRYKLTQQEMAGAIQASSQIIRTSHSPLQDILSDLGRLNVLSPEQGLEGAALAMRELTSGDTRSLVGRFEVSRDAANAMKREIQGGADAVQVLDRYLTSAGITDGALEASLAGASGQQREYNRAIEDLGLKVNQVVTSAGWREFQTGLIRSTTDEITALQNLAGWIDRIGARQAQSPLARQLDAVEEWASRPLHALARRLGLEDDPLSRITEMRDERDRRGATPNPAAAAPTPGPVRFAGFAAETDGALARAASRQARSLTAPQAGRTAPQAGFSPGPSLRAPQLTVIINTSGVFHTGRQLADFMRDAARDDAFRNAIEVLGRR